MIIQTCLKVQELVPSNVLSIWDMVILLQIAQQKGKDHMIHPKDTFLHASIQGLLS